MINFTNALIGGFIALWLQVVYLFYKLDSQKKAIIDKIMEHQLEIRELESRTDKRHLQLVGDIVVLRKRASALEALVSEIDTRTEEVKKAKDYIDSGHVFGWDAVASKFAWVKRDEDKDGVPGVIHINTGAFVEPSND